MGVTPHAVLHAPDQAVSSAFELAGPMACEGANKSAAAEPNAVSRWGTGQPVQPASDLASPRAMSDGAEAELDAILDRELASPSSPAAAPSVDAAGIATGTQDASFPADLDSYDFQMDVDVSSFNEPLFDDLAGSAWQPEIDLYSPGPSDGGGNAMQQAVSAAVSASPLRPACHFVEFDGQVTQDRYCPAKA